MSPRRLDERYAVTVSLTPTERAVVLALVDRYEEPSMMALLRTLLWSAAEDAKIPMGPADFTRPEWGCGGDRRSTTYKTQARPPKRDRRRATTRQPQTHPWRATIAPEADPPHGRPAPSGSEAGVPPASGTHPRVPPARATSRAETPSGR